MTESLDLGALFERDDVTMPDGTKFELRNQQELGVLDDFKLRSLMDRIELLQATAGQNEGDATKASELLKELAGMLVINCPADIEDWACVAIFRFWTNRISESADPSPKPRPRRTTAGSSRGSKRSTAATRKRGSTTRRGS